MMETMPLPDLPAFFFHAATGLRRSSPCAAASFCVVAPQVITKPGDCAEPQPPFLPVQNSYRADLFSSGRCVHADIFSCA